MPLSSRDEDQLRILSSFHYVLAALQALVAVFPAVDLVVGLGIVREPPGSGAGSYGWTLIATSLLAMVLGLAWATLTVMTGRRLREKRAHSFCMFVAGINCFFFPFGTILGALTLIVLKRPSVKAAFGGTTHLPNVASWEDRELP
jgi:hypothetical protein